MKLMKISTKTSGVSLHFEKHKGNNAGINRLQAHNERVEGGQHSNKNIDVDRTKDNIVLKKSDGSYYKQIKKIIENNRENGLKGVRKDAVRMVEATVQLSGQVLDRSEEEQEQVLRQSYEWLKNTYGEKNIVSAVIHKDETNMHLHFDFVPIDSDHKLNAKKLMSKGNLQKYQNQFLEYLQENNKSLNFVRGSGEYNGLSQEVYEKLQDERKDMIQDITEQELELNQKELELNRRETELNTRETALEARKEIFKAKVEQFDLERKNEAQKATERLKKLDKMTKELDVQRKSFDKHVHFAIQDIKTMMLKLYDMTLNQIKSMQKIEENIINDLDRNNDFDTFTEDIEALTKWQNEQLEDDLER